MKVKKLRSNGVIKCNCGSNRWKTLDKKNLEFQCRKCGDKRYATKKVSITVDIICK